MPSYLYGAPNGIPGDITRTDECNVEPIMLKAVNGVFAPAYGVALVLVPGGASQFAIGNVAADVAGILVREAPSLSAPGPTTFDATVPYPTFVQGMLVRGYVSVRCTQGTPVRGGAVYVRTVAAAGKLVGDFEATADGTNNVQLDTRFFSWATDGKDSLSNAEIRVAR